MHLARRQIARMVVLAVGLMVGCASSPSQARSPSSLVGLWATEGYGLVLDIGTDTLAVLEVTKVSCIPTLRARVTTAPAGALGAFTLSDAPVSFVILPGNAPAEARVHVAFAASDMIIRRIDRKPATCDAPTPDTPLSNFDVFAQTWAEHHGNST